MFKQLVHFLAVLVLLKVYTSHSVALKFSVTPDVTVKTYLIVFHAKHMIKAQLLDTGEHEIVTELRSTEEKKEEIQM